MNSFTRHAYAFFSILVLPAMQSFAQASLDYLEPTEGWQTAAAIELSSDGEHLVGSGSGDILYTNGEHGDAGWLATRHHYGDAIVSLDFMVPKGSKAGLYLLGRYEIKLSSSESDEPGDATAGAIGGGFDRNRDQAFAAVPPLVNASRPDGEWQTLSLRFRTLRFDEAQNKIDPAFLIDATLNGELVQQYQTIPYYTEGSMQNWEQASYPYAIRGANGPIAIRNFQIHHADFETVSVPNETAGETNVSQLVDHVATGEKTFKELGCIECHTTKKFDSSLKTGPNLYGLFKRAPRKREVEESGSGNRYFIDADLTYLIHSIRNPASELAVAESEPKTGQTYLPVMPPYSEELLGPTKASAIYSYLATLNDPGEEGPAQLLVTQTGPAQYDPLLDPMLILVDQRTRIQRGSMPGLSGRSIHVALPNAVNFSFDPRTLGIERIWQGGFLNAEGEWKNRGGDGFEPGFQSKEIELGDAGALIAPLLPSGKPADFSFKEAVFHDWETIDASLRSEEDHLDNVASVDAQFLGYTLDSTTPSASPTFNYRVGSNRISLRFEVDSEGTTTIEVSGNLPDEQRFALNTEALKDIKAETGRLDDNATWIVPPLSDSQAILRASLALSSSAWKPEPSAFDHLTQDLEIEPTEAELPPGYRSEQYLPPKDPFGRDLLFEATGIDVAPDGTIVVATRTSGIWRIVNGKWRLFAEGLFDSLGVVVEDQSGLQLVVGQKPELTRVTDLDGDGLADRFETLADQFSYHSNYHSYMHGPAQDKEGNYYFNLNLLHADDAIYKARGLYMGTSGGFSGWTIKVTPEGEFIPWANGLRSPAGLAFAPDGRLWYSENQGEFVGTSKLFVLNEGEFYGHPSGLVDLPGMQPDSPQIQWEAVAKDRIPAVVLFPHNHVANSPGNPAWDTTGGGFGPFAGQLFIGDQTQSKLFRVVTETVNNSEVGAVIPFAAELQSGIMRPVFLPDGSLLIGQTGRGWQARGGKVASLQRIVWDGETTPIDIQTVSQADEAFSIAFTKPISSSVSEESIRDSIAINSWTYRDAPDYGSPELDPVQEQIASLEISEDRKTIRIELTPQSYQSIENQTARVYHVEIRSDTLFESASPDTLECWITAD
ncbi:family 16 glycoside hydrolase [Pelagicoccus sp. SDUM812003]|uniref:family 16 glycoside hydrolase n=1 Tax=Pelagicoccus sp. SDUM812003 TaxID=3041267 RepID=UPI00280FEFD0|nr:family 16 glycoside hydrolase [Pelagicoccus sp. SDUM812003]MDQ8201715.1 DUF1080 domain-containing protein [Pelagicoccus sp. SDUM812003]